MASLRSAKLDKSASNLIKSLAGAQKRTPAEVMQRALALLHYVETEKANGGTLLLQYKDDPKKNDVEVTL